MEKFYRVENAFQILEMILAKSKITDVCSRYFSHIENARSIIQLEKDIARSKNKNTNVELNENSSTSHQAKYRELVDFVENSGSLEHKCELLQSMRIKDRTAGNLITEIRSKITENNKNFRSRPNSLFSDLYSGFFHLILRTIYILLFC